MVRVHPDPPAIRDAVGPAKDGRDGSEGAVAQLGERLLCKQEVIGSIPFSSTNKEMVRRQCIMIKAHRQATGLASDL